LIPGASPPRVFQAPLWRTKSSHERTTLKHPDEFPTPSFNKERSSLLEVLKIVLSGGTYYVFIS
jgi:hypothetical protein